MIPKRVLINTNSIGQRFNAKAICLFSAIALSCQMFPVVVNAEELPQTKLLNHTSIVKFATERNDVALAQNLKSTGDLLITDDLSIANNPAKNKKSDDEANVSIIKSKVINTKRGSLYRLPQKVSNHIRPYWHPPEGRIGDTISTIITVDANGNVIKMMTNSDDLELKTSIETAILNASPLTPLIDSRIYILKIVFKVIP